MFAHLETLDVEYYNEHKTGDLMTRFTSDLNAIYSNQRSGRIQLKGLSNAYVDGIEYLVEVISGASQGEVRKAVKRL